MWCVFILGTLLILIVDVVKVMKKTFFGFFFSFLRRRAYFVQTLIATAIMQLFAHFGTLGILVLLMQPIEIRNKNKFDISWWQHITNLLKLVNKINKNFNLFPCLFFVFSLYFIIHRELTKIDFLPIFFNL